MSRWMQIRFILHDNTGPAARQDIVAFLGALDGEFPEQTMPRLPATPGDLITGK